MSTPSTPVIKKTLGLTGVTVNAMALIAPGAFLWMTYQLQAASIDSAGKSTAQDMWTGVVAALVIWKHRENIGRLRAGTENQFKA